MDKVFYNEGSAAKLGWDPSWFGCDEFDDRLVKEISKWQKKLGIKPDGLCGPTTFRRIFNERESKINEYIPSDVKAKDKAYIVHHGSFHPIEWDKVVLWSEDGGLKLTEGFTPYF